MQTADPATTQVKLDRDLAKLLAFKIAASDHAARILRKTVNQNTQSLSNFVELSPLRRRLSASVDDVNAAIVTDDDRYRGHSYGVLKPATVADR